METTLASAEIKTARLAAHPAALPASTPEFSRSLEDRQFLVMQRAFRATGGVVTGDQLAYLLRNRARQPISLVAHWVVARQVVSYEWRSQTMLPLFQFHMPSAAPRSSVTELVSELKDMYTDWELALWFVQSNAWLGGLAPVKAIEMAPRAVLDAARADRFIANG